MRMSQVLTIIGAVAALTLMTLMSLLHFKKIYEVDVSATSATRRNLAVKCRWQYWKKKTNCQGSSSEKQIRSPIFEKKSSHDASSKWISGNREASDGINGTQGGIGSAQPSPLSLEASISKNYGLDESIGDNNGNMLDRNKSSYNVSNFNYTGGGCEGKDGESESRFESNLTTSFGEGSVSDSKIYSKYLCNRTTDQSSEALYSPSRGKINATSNWTTSKGVIRFNDDINEAVIEQSRVKRIAVCLTGQVRSFEEISGNLRDMIVRPLQQLVDLPMSMLSHNNTVASTMPSLQKPLNNFTRKYLYTSLDSNVHMYATISLNDTIEMKGFRCTKTKHSRQKVTEILASLGASVYGFIEDDEKARSGPINGCKAWPGFVQADQMKQCWAMVTATEKRQGWQYDYALRVRPDVAYKRSFRLAHWPLFAPLVQVLDQINLAILFSLIFIRVLSVPLTYY